MEDYHTQNFKNSQKNVNEISEPSFNVHILKLSKISPLPGSVGHVVTVFSIPKNSQNKTKNYANFQVNKLLNFMKHQTPDTDHLSRTFPSRL